MKAFLEILTWHMHNSVEHLEFRFLGSHLS